MEIHNPVESAVWLVRFPIQTSCMAGLISIDHLWKLLEGNNVLLLAPRRFGKSGVMRHILLKPQADFLPLSFELEDVDSPEEFVWRVTQGTSRA